MPLFKSRSCAFKAFLILLALSASITARLAAVPLIGFQENFLFLWPVILIALWLGGVATGLITSALCLLTACYFSEPFYSFQVSRLSDLVSIVIFVTLASALTMIADKLKKEQEEKISLAMVHEVNVRTIHALMKRAMNCIIVVDSHDKVLYINERASKVTGWTQREASGMDFPTIWKLAPDSSGLGAAILVAKDGQNRKIEQAEPTVYLGDLGRVIIFNQAAN